MKRQPSITPAPAGPSGLARLTVLLLLAARAAWAGADEDYLAGLNELEAGRWDAAAQRFAAAQAAAPDEARYPLALGVAQLLGEQAPQALATFRRARRLAGEADRAARMWFGAAQCMVGDLDQARLTGGFDFNDPYEKLVYDAFNSYGMSVFLARQGSDPAQVDRWRREGAAVFPQVAREFARRAKVGGGAAVGRMLLADAERLLDEGRLSEALAVIEHVRAAGGGDDLYAACLEGELLVRLDAPAAARPILTDALTLAPDAARAYLWRAIAHARLGAVTAARRDLDRARESTAADPRLRLPDDAAAQLREVETLSAKPAGDAAALLRELLDRPADDGAGAVETALRLHRATERSRLRWDEGYQEGLRAAWAATRDHPRDADAWAGLADYLDRHMEVWSESVEPLAAPRAFRRHDPDGERKRTLEAADAALALNPRHAGAMASRAAALAGGGDAAGAETWARRALAQQPVPRAMEVLIDILDRAAAAREAEAARLRSPRVETTRETRADGEYIVTRTYPPTAADLAAAARLEAEARTRRAESAALYEKLLAATRGTPEEIFQRARFAWRTGDRDRARALLREITAPRSSDPRYHHQLLEWMAGGDAAAYDEQFSDSANRIHSTAAGMLRIAWRALQRGTFQAGDAALARAAALDPADARSLVYRALALDEQDRLAEAGAAYRAALAMEAARLRLFGRGLRGSAGRLGDDDWPLSAAAALRYALLLSRTGQDAAVADLLTPLLAGLDGRVNLPDPGVTRVERLALPVAQLPGPDGESSVVPRAPEARTLLAWLRVAAGDSFRRTGRTAEAGAAYVAALGPAGRDIRPLASYNAEEKALLAAARDRIPVSILDRYDMAVTLAEQGAIACGAIRSAAQIHEEEQAGRERRYQAEGDLTREYLRRSQELNRDMAQRQRALDRFDHAGREALIEDYRRKQAELDAWREGEMRRIHGPDYR